MELVIFDGRGYWVKMRRVNGRIVHLWSPKRNDAFRFHFREVAERTAALLPQKVSIRPNSYSTEER